MPGLRCLLTAVALSLPPAFLLFAPFVTFPQHLGSLADPRHLLISCWAIGDAGCHQQDLVVTNPAGVSVA